MTKHNKQIKQHAAVDAAAAAAADAAAASREAEAIALAQEALSPQCGGAGTVGRISALQSMGYRKLAEYVTESAAKAVIRPANTELALAHVRDSIGPGFFDEAESIKKGADYQIPEAVAPLFMKLMRQYAPDAVVSVRPGTPFFPQGAWVPGEQTEEEARRPAILREGCVPLRILGNLLAGGGWVWVRPRPEGGIASIRFPFHRAAINTVQAVEGAVFSRDKREWSMAGGADATVLLDELMDVFKLEEVPDGQGS